MSYLVHDFVRETLVSPLHAAALVGRGLADLMAAMQMGVMQTPMHYPAHVARAFFDNVEIATARYEKPAWSLAASEVAGRQVPVEIEKTLEKPFGDLLHFKKESTAENEKTVLLVAPMSGHYATLLRDTVRALLPGHDVYVTDWKNARDVPVAAGRFGLDDYMDYAADFLRHITETTGKPVHVMTISQSTVPLLSAVAVMNAENSPFAPATLTLMGGPIDTRAAPTSVTKLGQTHDIDAFRQLIEPVPYGYAGAGRAVYPGYRQLSGFLALNPAGHAGKAVDHFHNVVTGNAERAASHRDYYHEFLAVADIAKDVFLETVQRVFINHDLPKGRMDWRGTPVDTAAITRTALLTVEAERDDICAPGQTVTAHRMASNLAENKRGHIMVPGVDHFGLFHGPTFVNGTLPKISAFMHAHNA